MYCHIISNVTVNKNIITFGDVLLRIKAEPGYFFE